MCLAFVLGSLMLLAVGLLSLGNLAVGEARLHPGERFVIVVGDLHRVPVMVAERERM
jgi:hypothetical protein